MSFLREWTTVNERAATIPFLPAPNVSTRLLVIVPHPDDETLCAGGAIFQTQQNGGAARVIFLTCGDGSRSTQIALHLQRRAHYSFRAIGELRRREALAATRELGLCERDAQFLGFPDGGLRTIWRNHRSEESAHFSPPTRTDCAPYAFATRCDAPYNSPSLLRELQTIITEFRPTQIVTTHPSDTHADHIATFLFTRAALHAASLSTQPRLLASLVHRGVWPLPHGAHPEYSIAPPSALQTRPHRWMQLPLNEEAQVAKARALARHRSQMVFTPHYLRGFLRRNELFDEYSASLSP